MISLESLCLSDIESRNNYWTDLTEIVYKAGCCTQE